MPFRIRPYDTDNGSEFINRDLIAWLQERDIEQTRSRPYRSTSSAFSTSYRSWCASRPTCSPRPRSPSAGPAPATGGRGASTTSRAPRGRGSRSSTRRTGPREDRDSSCPANARRSNGSSPRRTPRSSSGASTPYRTPRTAQLARRAGPDMAYLNKTLARIAGVEPEDDETRQADED